VAIACNALERGAVSRHAEEFSAREDSPLGGSSLRKRLPAASVPRCLVRELLIAVWRCQGWPLGAMGFVEWDLLAEMIDGAAGVSHAAPRKRMFPGGVTAEAMDGMLRLERLE